MTKVTESLDCKSDLLIAFSRFLLHLNEDFEPSICYLSEFGVQNANEKHLSQKTLPVHF